MNIGEASEQSGLPVKTIRYYEDIGLVRPLRSENGYRDFIDADLQRLKFLQRSRSLGFSIDECVNFCLSTRTATGQVPTSRRSPGRRSRKWIARSRSCAHSRRFCQSW